VLQWRLACRWRRGLAVARMSPVRAPETSSRARPVIALVFVSKGLRVALRCHFLSPLSLAQANYAQGGRVTRRGDRMSVGRGGVEIGFQVSMHTLSKTRFQGLAAKLPYVLKLCTTSGGKYWNDGTFTHKLINFEP
jgi:hypothetical protein